jgi:hypothetical protein
MVNISTGMQRFAMENGINYHSQVTLSLYHFTENLYFKHSLSHFRYACFY